MVYSTQFCHICDFLGLKSDPFVDYWVRIGCFLLSVYLINLFLGTIRETIIG